MTTNDTRTTRERAEKLAAENFPLGEAFANTEHTQIQIHRAAGFVTGYLARDTEPTTEALDALKALAHKFQYSAWTDVMSGDIQTKMRNANAMTAWLRAYITEQEQG